MVSGDLGIKLNEKDIFSERGSSVEKQRGIERLWFVGQGGGEGAYTEGRGAHGGSPKTRQAQGPDHLMKKKPWGKQLLLGGLFHLELAYGSSKKGGGGLSGGDRALCPTL